MGPDQRQLYTPRLVFVRNPQAKERLMPYHDAGNVNKFMTAPVVAIMDIERVDAEFFPDGKVKSNFICAIGCGDASRLHPRGPRLEFNGVVQVA